MKHLTQKILLIEDDDAIAEVIEVILSEAGYQVHYDSTGEAVLKKPDQDQYDLALIDYLLPKKNGTTIIKTLRTLDNFKHIPIILMSANTESELSEMSHSCGASDYLAKPFDIEVLLGKIKRLLTA